MQKQIPPRRAFSCIAPTLAPNLAASQRNLQPPSQSHIGKTGLYGAPAVRKDGGFFRKDPHLPRAGRCRAPMLLFFAREGARATLATAAQAIRFDRVTSFS